jgi:hypothetical protein
MIGLLFALVSLTGALQVSRRNADWARSKAAGRAAACRWGVCVEMRERVIGRAHRRALRLASAAKLLPAEGVHFVLQAQ